MASKRPKEAISKDETPADSLSEDLGRLNLNVDGAGDTSTAQSASTTTQKRYNLRSRNKTRATSEVSQPHQAGNSTGTKQALITRYLPPHQRGKDSRDTTVTEKDNTATIPTATDSGLPIRPRRQIRTTDRLKSNQLNADATTFQPSHNWRTEPEGLDDDDGGVRLPVEQPAKQNKHLQILKRPIPSPAYLKQATQSLHTLDAPKQLLVVLDLNGTLLYRKQRGGASFVARPMVNDFIQYLLAYHKVMVWSSARPENVTRMCEKLFDKEQRQELAAVWARDTLRIPSAAYNSKVQVYKQLSWVWKDKSIQATHPDAKGVWDQSNTVLLDDSVEKAASEPHNSICLEEFQNLPEQRSSDVLGQVVKYLEMLKREKDVSAFMQLTPFTYAPGETFDWRI